jgi:hypothetical protein
VYIHTVTIMPVNPVSDTSTVLISHCRRQVISPQDALLLWAFTVVSKDVVSSIIIHLDKAWLSCGSSGDLALILRRNGVPPPPLIDDDRYILESASRAVCLILDNAIGSIQLRDFNDVLSIDLKNARERLKPLTIT